MLSKLKKISIFLTLLISIFIVGNFSQAQKSKYGISETATTAGLEQKVAGAGTVEELIGSVVSIVLSIVGIVFFLLILYAGFNWMTARGNSEKIDKSKDTIESAAIGIIVVLAAYAITNFVFSSLATTGGSTVNQDQPCTDAGGICGPSATCVPANIRTGLCSGGADNVCCVP